jgi:cytosine/uracil/thiamine/allantoin permease
MATVKKSKAAHYASRLAVESEPGLTTAQLMLYNHDLAPVDPERRQWGMNFISKSNSNKQITNVPQVHGTLSDSGLPTPLTSTHG